MIARLLERKGATVQAWGGDVQGIVTVNSVIWQRDMGGDQGDAQVTDGFPSPGSATDHGDDVETRGRSRVGVPSVR